MKICIVAHFAYGAMIGGTQGHFGGVERQTTLLAKWLAERGHDVSLLTWDEGQEDQSLINGVRLINICRQEAGVPGLRFFHPRWTGLVDAMRKADAEIYYQNCAECVTGQIALWCKRNQRAFVFSSASDTNCDPQLPSLNSFKEKWLYRYGINHADKLIVQTKQQLSSLKNGFNLDAEILAMPCPGPHCTDSEKISKEDDGQCNILWAGRINHNKRLEMFLKIARLSPSLTFHIAGAPDRENDYATRLISEAKSLKNTVYHGKVQRSEMFELYSKAHFLCCTSHYEGFPNTYIEAWSYGVPVVSTIDPDGIIEKHNLGIQAKDAKDMKFFIDNTFSNPDEYNRLSNNARKYFLSNHSIDEIMPQMEGLFIKAIEEKKIA